jgi:hypothetical protein
VTEEEYKIVCTTCDDILLSSDVTNERISIPWLHVIREHPVFLVNYSELSDKQSSFKFKYTLFFKILKYLAGWIRQFYRAIFISEKTLTFSDKITHPVDVLFISHFLNKKHAGKTEDFYFGPVPQELSSKGYSVVIGLINPTEECASDVAEKWKEANVKRIIFARTIGLMGEAFFFKRMIKESFRLISKATNAKTEMQRKVLQRASVEALSGSTRNTIRIFQQITEVVRVYKPRIIVVTHEGHAWERLAFATTREISPFTKCIGYQHSALFRLQHAIRRNLAEQFNPDHIFTSGMVAKNQLEKAVDLDGVSVSVLGSNRNLGIKKEITQNEFFKKNEIYRCIVLPEADFSECNILFSFSITCAIECPNIQFLWRLHPLFSFDKLIEKNAKFKELPSNVILSDCSLEEDLLSSRWALYRGTTTIIQAVGAGVQPVYLSLPQEMTIDPLYEIDAWKPNITDVTSFRKVVEANLTENDFNEMRKMLDYCTNFFLKFKSDQLLSYLQNGTI